MPYGSDLSEDQLRLMARARIDDGRLPRMVSSFFTPHYGLDELCELCDQGIDQYRVGYHRADPRDWRRALTFHLVCYKSWQLESSKVS